MMPEIWAMVGKIPYMVSSKGRVKRITKTKGLKERVITNNKVYVYFEGRKTTRTVKAMQKEAFGVLYNCLEVINELNKTMLVDNILDWLVLLLDLEKKRKIPEPPYVEIS